jgi:NitT/TauT family transport system substrate-binding protein
MRSKSFFSILLAITLLLTGVTGCAQSKQAKTESVAQQTLKIGSLTIEENLPLLVAEKNSYLAKENVKIELVPFQSPVELQSAFQTGDLDGMITDIMIAAMLQSSGIDLRVTSIALGATPQEGRFAIVASPKSNIKTVQDLKGKSIGISNNSIIEYVTDGLLQEGGVNPSETKKTTVAKIPVRVEMLLNNQIDAITVPDPQISYLVAQGAKIIAEDTKGENLSQSVILMKGDTIKEKTDVISNFYKAYSKAVDDINQTPDQYKDLLVKNVNIPENVVDSYKVQHYSKPQLPNENEVNNVISWLKDKNLLKNEVTYQGFVKAGLY